MTAKRSRKVLRWSGLLGLIAFGLGWAPSVLSAVRSAQEELYSQVELLAEAITIIGIPFALKDLQLAQIAIAPIGREVVKR